MATPQENAALADAVYAGPGKTQAPPGWDLIQESPTNPGNEGSANGYYGAAFRNQQTGEIVVANRGSRMSGEGLQQDWLGSDVKIAKQDPNDIPPAFGDANAFARSVQAKNPGAKVSYTGHSLGGGEAQVQAATMGGEATTFGAPGVKFAVTDAQARAVEGKVTNYALPGDPVPLSGEHIGGKTVLTPTGSTLMRDAAAIGLGLVVGGLPGLLIAVAGVAATHMLGNYIDALSELALPAMPAMPSMPSAPSMPGVPAGKPQARVGDMHVCPMVSPGPVPHVGGPVLPPAAVTVLVGGMPAARVGDLCTCVGPPDVIALGSFTVLIMGQPAARIGDMTVHGGNIVMGMPTVLTG